MSDKVSKSKLNLGRRGFLKSAVVSGVAGIAASSPLLAAQSPPAQQNGCKQSWEIAPPPIPESEIKNTVTTDVVVVGAGIAGITTALSAAEGGLKVIILEKGKTYSVRGFDVAAVDSRVQKKMGVKIDVPAAIRALIKNCDKQIKEELYWIWTRHSGKALDWILDQVEPAGLVAKLSTAQYKGPNYFEYPVTHHILGGPHTKDGSFIDVVDILVKNAKGKGVDFRYRTPGARLIREGKGPVTGVIAGTAGNYTRFTAGKGVVMATGDYGSNKEMLSYYCPIATYVDHNVYTPIGANVGDGHKMGLWAGAAFQKGTHAPMIHTVGGAWPYFFLHVNKHGLRYQNEDISCQGCCLGKMMQPDGIGWTILDSDFLKYVPQTLAIGGGFFWDHPDRNMGEEWKPDADMAALEDNIKAGLAFRANTWDELAAKMKVPAEALKKTVARYNELVKKGVDEDFGKRKELLFPIEKPPFYAGLIKSALLATTSGLRVNTKLEVLDAQDEPLGRFYAVGNVQGDMFAVDYPTVFPGLSHGRCITFGRMVGLHLAGKQM
ncbi:MAG TPA: FAD-dependent oxidoreductase [Acidobacteriota bacterium]|nr:FAD-dependent oxidoreductase [Acidobacteriota bacterium]